MGKKRRIKDIWVAIFAILGAILIVFSSTTNNKVILMVSGIILVIISIIISLSKAWTK